MPVRVRLARWRTGFMRMLMMLVVAVAMFVPYRLVKVLVLVSL